MHKTDAGKIVALPMYDFDALACAHDTLWTSLAAHLTVARVTDIPTRLCRGMNYRDGWRNPRLLFSQGCEYPLATTVAGYVRVVAIPHYDVPGCSGPRYSSAIVVAREHPATRLEDMRGSRCVVNTLDSNSGMNLLRAAIAPLVGHSCGGGFFQSVSVSGAHWQSAKMIAAGQADLAAIDCVTFAHLRHLYPQTMAGLRVLGWTPSSPALPFITARSTSDTTVQALRTALKSTLADPHLAEIRASLHLVDVEIDLDPTPNFSEVLGLGRAAAERGYPTLA